MHKSFDTFFISRVGSTLRLNDLVTVEQIMNSHTGEIMITLNDKGVLRHVKMVLL